jgi:hypothetical protein
MTTGWPQNEQDLRWPYSDANEAGPDRQAGGRVATDSDRIDRSAGASGLWADHPSAPLPVTPAPEPRGRRGRSRGDRDKSGPADTVGDADYDWIRYLGEAGPAQEHSKRPAEPRPSSSEEDSRGGRGAGRRSRRHAAPEQPAPEQSAPARPTPVQPTADTDTRPSAAHRTGGHRARATHSSDLVAPDRVGRDRAMPERGMPDRIAPERGMPDRIAPERGARDRMPPERPLSRPAEPAPQSWTSGLAGPVTSPGFPRPDYSRPPTSRHAITQPNAASTTSAWPASPARPDQAAPRHGHDSGGWPRPEAIADPSTDHSGRHFQPAQAAAVASRAVAGRAAAESASDRDLGIERPGGRTASRRTAATAEVPAGNTAVIAPPRTAPGATVPAKSRKNATSRKAKRRKVRHPVRLVVGGGAVAVVAAAGVVFVPHLLKQNSGPAHSVSTPTKLQSWVQDPALAASMGATELRTEIVNRGRGEASHVVDAVYEDTAGSAAKKAPLILLFVGGNLSGSAGGFISSFTGSLQSAFVTSPGSLGGQAACVPGVGGHPAECAWADGDTFGLIASPDLSASVLAHELRLMRPQVEHIVK